MYRYPCEGQITILSFMADAASTVTLQPTGTGNSHLQYAHGISVCGTNCVKSRALIMQLSRLNFVYKCILGQIILMPKINEINYALKQGNDSNFSLTQNDEKFSPELLPSETFQ